MCEGGAAVFALLAAVAWFIAASHPVALPEAAMWAEATSGYPERAKKILRGVRWNMTAAALTGCSALATFLAWLLG